MMTDPSTITTIDELRESIVNNNIFPLYLFHGTEDFLVDEIVELLIDQVLDDSARSFNYDVVDAADAKDVMDLVTSFPLQSDKRVVLVKDLDKIDERERLIPLFENPVESTVLIMRSEKRDLRMNVYKVLQRAAVAVEFKQLYESRISSWIIDRVQKRGKKMSNEAAELLHSYTGRSLREISNEIDKLFIYVYDRTLIEADDVNAVVGMSREYNIFELQKAVGKKDLPNTLKILDRMFSAGKPPTDIVRMLTKYFTTLWIYKDLSLKIKTEAKIAEVLKVKSFALKEYSQASKVYTDTEVENCFEALLKADVALKTSRPANVVLSLLGYAIVRGKQDMISFP